MCQSGFVHEWLRNEVELVPVVFTIWVLAQMTVKKKLEVCWTNSAKCTAKCTAKRYRGARALFHTSTLASLGNAYLQASKTGQKLIPRARNRSEEMPESKT